MLIKVAGCTLNQIPIDWEGNKSRIIETIKLAKKDSVKILCLPELSITGYGCEDIFFNSHVHEKSLDILFEIARETSNIIVSIGLPVMYQNNLFNCTAMIADGRIVGFRPKKNLARDGVHYEPRWFSAWPSKSSEEIEIRKIKYPIGDLHFDFSGLKVGFEICEEAWTSNRPGKDLSEIGIDIILNPSASHFAFDKLKARKSLVVDGSKTFSTGYVYSNLLGNESGRIIFDGGVMIASGGNLLAQGQRFSFKDFSLTTAVVDVEKNRVLRNRTSSNKLTSEDKNNLCVRVDYKVEENQHSKDTLDFEDWENSENLKEEEFTRAVALGLFDFLRKSHQNGFVISISGGIDSAAVTSLCQISLVFAANELGLSGLKKKLSHIKNIQSMDNITEISKALITCAYQSTKNSSTDTFEAAKAVANEVNATFYDWSIEPVLENYLKISQTALDEKLTWEKYDTTLQNIQARARGPSIWILANVKRALLLATSNRSEAAVGYSTMDGDTCGGLSPIGGIDKNFLRQWFRWMSKNGPESLSPLSSFELVLSKPPTAELRPSQFKQTDEDDLMPYEVLDQIEKLAIRDKKSPLECFKILSPDFKDLKELKSWVIKFFRLWCQNQWKRERYAPAFHLDDESLDPKTWCRFPILMSGFELEIKELEELKI